MVEKPAAWDLDIVRRPKDAEGWATRAIRWTVERLFAWRSWRRCRRLITNQEKSTLSPESFITLAMIQLMARRLQPS